MLRIWIATRRWNCCGYAIADVLDRFIRAPIDLELPSAKLPKASASLLSGRTQHLDVLRRPLFRWTEAADHRLRRDSVQQ